MLGELMRSSLEKCLPELTPTSFDGSRYKNFIFFFFSKNIMNQEDFFFFFLCFRNFLRQAHSIQANTVIKLARSQPQMLRRV